MTRNLVGVVRPPRALAGVAGRHVGRAPRSRSLRRATVRLLSLAALLALAPPLARGQVEGDTWEDPTLERAVREADLIVLAECTAVARGGGAAYLVKKTFKGKPRDGREVMVIGLAMPDASPEEPPVPVGDEAYLLLQGDPAAAVLAVPTPTFGRFPVQQGGVVVGSFSDTFVRLGVPRARWEQVLTSLVAGAADPALMAHARATVAKKDADPNAVYEALEVLAMFGAEQDRAAVEAVLADPRFAEPPRFRVRLAAVNALMRIGGAASARRLVAVVEQDPLDVVKSAAATALGPVLEGLVEADPATARHVVDRLVALTPGARSAPIRFGTAHDPRENQLHGLLGAILKTLGRIKARAGVAPALRALERVDDGPALVAGLLFFQDLGDPQHAGAIAWRMRRPDAEDAYYNPLFTRTLEALTGQRFGTDRDAWVRWCREQALLPQGPDAPLGATPGGEGPAPPGDGGRR